MTSEHARPVTAQEPEFEPLYCACQAIYSLDRDHHDMLVSFEARGVAGAVELIDSFEVAADGDEAPAGTLEWFELGDFVSMHNWSDPLSVHRLASYIDRTLHDRSERCRLAGARS